MEPRSHYRTAPVFACVLFGVSAVGSAYPIAPRTLWDLALESERVVVARVEASVIESQETTTSKPALPACGCWKHGRARPCQP